MPMPTCRKLTPATLVLLAGFGLTSGCQQEVEPLLPEALAAKATEAAAPETTVQETTAQEPTAPAEAFATTIDCAALLAVHESVLHGSLSDGSQAFSLISYALGKAQEYALQAGLAAAQVKIRYAEKTLEYYQQHGAAPASFMQATQARADQCHKDLRQFEPGAQVQDAIRKARDAAAAQQH